MTETPRARRTWREHARSFLGALLIVVLTFGAIELGLRWLDPWGLHYFTDLETLANDIYTPDPLRGYTLRDGVYHLSNWTLTVADEARVVPTTAASAACKVAILGDSVAMGNGVSDDQVWINQIAPEYPNVRFVNYGVTQYNSSNVLGTLRKYPDADAYLYLIIYNDVNPAIDMTTQRFSGARSNELMIIRYMNFALYHGGNSDRPVFDDPAALLPESPESERFFADLDQITADSRVTLAAFADEPLTNSINAQGYTLDVLPPYPGEYRLSYTDYHLNPQGNAVLAGMLNPVVGEMITSACE